MKGSLRVPEADKLELQLTALESFSDTIIGTTKNKVKLYGEMYSEALGSCK